MNHVLEDGVLIHKVLFDAMAAPFRYLLLFTGFSACAQFDSGTSDASHFAAGLFL